METDYSRQITKQDWQTSIVRYTSKAWILYSEQEIHFHWGRRGLTFNNYFLIHSTNTCLFSNKFLSKVTIPNSIISRLIYFSKVFFSKSFEILLTSNWDSSPTSILFLSIVWEKPELHIQYNIQYMFELLMFSGLDMISMNTAEFVYKSTLNSLHIHETQHQFLF